MFDRDFTWMQYLFEGYQHGNLMPSARRSSSCSSQASVICRAGIREWETLKWPCILPLLPHNNPQTLIRWFNTVIYTLNAFQTVSVGQRFGGALAGCWLAGGVSRAPAIMCQTELQSLEGWAGAGEWTPSVAPFHDSPVRLAVGRRPWLLSLKVSPQDCLSVLTAWRPTSSRAR